MKRSQDTLEKMIECFAKALLLKHGELFDRVTDFFCALSSAAPARDTTNARYRQVVDY